MKTPDMKTIDTSLLRVAYEEWNATATRTVILLHGWPDSPRTWAKVAPELAQQGWRVIVPALRGFAPTHFLKSDTPRTGQLAALGRDLVEFIHALKLQQPALVGHDWGARAAANACGLSANIASHLVMVSVGYGTNLPNQKLDFAQAKSYWYHWLMATEKGEQLIRADKKAFAKIMWDTWSPAGWYSPEEFDATWQAVDNDDWLPVTLHSYRHRWGHAPSDPYYAADEAVLQDTPKLSVPTLVLHGEADTVNHPSTSEGKERFFTNEYKRTVLPGIGHFPQRENPALITKALLEFLH
jgi:pimeloyl-ACP methyl ester carboxylesterase